MTYPLTFYVKCLAPNVGSEARGPFIRILEKYRNDKGIYRHELLHVGQWAVLSLLGLPIACVLNQIGRMDLMWLSLLPISLHSLLYAAVPSYKLWAEVQAYREQAKHYTDDRRPPTADRRPPTAVRGVHRAELRAERHTAASPGDASQMTTKHERLGR